MRKHDKITMQIKKERARDRKRIRERDKKLKPKETWKQKHMILTGLG